MQLFGVRRCIVALDSLDSLNRTNTSIEGMKGMKSDDASSHSKATSLTAALKQTATELGFVLVGVCPAATPTGLSRLQAWLQRGFDGQMAYLRERATAYEHPRHVLDGVRSVVMLAFPYRTEQPSEAPLGHGRVSRYAWNSQDYHDVLHAKLKQLTAHIQELSPQARARGVVDTAPLLERDFAQRAGLGWIAKNTMLINKSVGSWFFLAALLTDQELDYDEPHETDHCGSCTACLDACPTQAFPEPYVLDARRCISYLTIELRGSIPKDFRSAVGDWVFGCDICQEVCPWNRKGAEGDSEIFSSASGMNPMELGPLFEMTEEDFRREFRHTPLWRTKRRGLLRNAAIVLGNQRSLAALPALSSGMADSEPLVRSACAWALGRIGGDAARELLATRLARESDLEVREEIQAALTDSAVAREP
jgi:epoxyqueuosine reductase